MLLEKQNFCSSRKILVFQLRLRQALCFQSGLNKPRPKVQLSPAQPLQETPEEFQDEEEGEFREANLARCGVAKVAQSPKPCRDKFWWHKT